MTGVKIFVYLMAAMYGASLVLFLLAAILLLSDSNVLATKRTRRQSIYSDDSFQADNNGITFNDIPLDIQARFGLPCPITRLHIGFSGVGGCMLTPENFFKDVTKSGCGSFPMFKDFFQGRYDPLLRKDRINRDWVIGAINLLASEWSGLGKRLETMRAHGPRVTFDAPFEMRNWNPELMKPQIAGLLYKFGSMQGADMRHYAFLKCFYRSNFIDMEAAAEKFNNHNRLLSAVLTNRPMLSYNGRPDAFGLATILQYLPNENIDFEDPLSMVHFLTNDEAMKVICEENILGGKTAKLALLCINALDRQMAILQNNMESIEDMRRRLKLTESLAKLLAALGLEEGTVRRVIGWDYTVSEMEQAGSNIFFFIVKDRPEVLRQKYHLIPQSMFGELTVSEAADFMVETGFKNVSDEKFCFNLTAHDVDAYILVLQKIATGLVDANLLRSLKRQKLIRLGMKFSCLRHWQKASAMVETLDWTQIELIMPAIEGMWKASELDRIVDLDKPLPKLLWLHIEREMKHGSAANLRRIFTRLLAAKTEYETTNIKQPMLESLHDLYFLNKLDPAKIMADIERNKFLPDRDVRFLRVYNHDLDRFAVYDKANLVEVALWTTPGAKWESERRLITSVPETCRIVDLYWIVHCTSLSLAYPRIMYDEKCAPIPLHELVKDHPKILVTNPSYDEDEWIDKQIEAIANFDH